MWMIPAWMQIFALHDMCRLVLWWCCGHTDQLFARLLQLNSFKRTLPSHLEHCPDSMDSTINIVTPLRDCCHCCSLTLSQMLIFVWPAHWSSLQSFHTCVCHTDGHLNALIGQVHSFCSMLIHWHTFHSCRTDSFSSKGPKISDLIVCCSQLLSLAKIQHGHTAGMILHCWHDHDQSCLLLLLPVAPSSDWVSSFLQHPHTASVHCRIWAHSSSSCSNHWHKALLLNSFKSLAHS